MKKHIIFLTTLLILCIFYRFFLFTQTPTTLFGTWPTQSSLLLFGLLSDAISCIAITTIIIAITHLFKLNQKFYLLLCATTYLIISFIFLIKIKLLTTLYIDINYTLISAYFHQGLSSLSLVNFTKLSDVIFIADAIIIFILLNLTNVKINSRYLLYSVMFIYSVGIAIGANTFGTRSGVLNERLIALYENPVNRLTKSFIKSHQGYNAIVVTDNNKIFPTQQMHTIHPNSKKWNVVIFILESVGSEYVSASMPFLKQLSKQSAWYENNYSPGNISALGQFGILTGLYPNPTATHFEMQNDLHIPTIANWLKATHHSFLVTASNDLYYSKTMCDSFNQYDNAKTMGVTEPLFFDMFMDERKAFSFFKTKLSKETQPFVALYWSNAPHFPYKDYRDPQYVISEPENAYARYLNSLHLLDQEIKETYQTLKKQHLLDKTIFVVVGDHGESFGKHQFFIHGHSLFNEETKVPLLIYAPALFKPGHITRTTSSIDILPTILDALNVRYSNKLQGESLLRASNRKYTFIYGDQDDIAAIDSEQNKMIISFSENTCQIYNLKHDRDEIKPTACYHTPLQQAILQFRHDQPLILNTYNN